MKLHTVLFLHILYTFHAQLLKPPEKYKVKITDYGETAIEEQGSFFILVKCTLSSMHSVNLNPLFGANKNLPNFNFSQN